VPIHIKEIRVESLGPLKNLNLNPGMVTLVYGHNEQGKTYLVEFLIRSLFKKNGFDDLRVTGTRGEVRLVGIGVDPWVCSPKNSRKLDDLITRDPCISLKFTIYGVGVISAGLPPVQLNTRGVLVSPPDSQMGVPSLVVPVWRTT
jgi:energy-coupling factor transporter ATP-binding protein EcfA2